jgi:glucose-1-phosphate cytidylyltransferase
MKVVLFCGGLGTRLREHSDTIPKPLVSIGPRPLIWHLMRYYAYYGHTEFILCLGYRGDLVRKYFLNYEEEMTNDFTLYGKDRRVELHSQDLDGWKITFVDTGLHSNIAERLLRVRKFVEHEEMFLANYADGLSDLPLDKQIQEFKNSSALVSLVAVPSNQSVHALRTGPEGIVTHIGPMADQAFWVNGGFFIMRPNIFKYIREGEELVEKPFERLIAERKLMAFQWGGFWQSMDTFKDKIGFDRMEARGDCPWMVWKRHQRGSLP